MGVATELARASTGLHVTLHRCPIATGTNSKELAILYTCLDRDEGGQLSLGHQYS